MINLGNAKEKHLEEKKRQQQNNTALRTLKRQTDKIASNPKNNAVLKIKTCVPSQSVMGNFARKHDDQPDARQHRAPCKIRAEAEPSQ